MTVKDYGTTEPKATVRSDSTRVTGQIDVLVLPDVPARERWIWDNPHVLGSLLRSRAQAGRGEIHYLGSFAEFADDDDD